MRFNKAEFCFQIDPKCAYSWCRNKHVMVLCYAIKDEKLSGRKRWVISWYGWIHHLPTKDHLVSYFIYLSTQPYIHLVKYSSG